MASDWVSGAESLDGFTPLQLDTFYAPGYVYDLSSERSRTAARDERENRHPTLSAKEVLRRFSIVTKIVKPVVSGKGRAGRPWQVNDVHSPCWRVFSAGNDSEELKA